MDEADITIENEAELTDPTSALKSLREKLRACEREKKEYLDGWQRSKADFVNARAVEERERDQFTKYANRAVLLDVIKIADLFDLAFAQKEWASAPDSWRKGVESIASELGKTLTKHGLLPFGAVGEPFNPSLHQPMTTLHTDDPTKDETIAQIIQRGYKLHDTVIRPAHVIMFIHTNH